MTIATALLMTFGIVLFVGIVLVIAFAAVAAAQRNEAKALETEGIVLRSGRTWVKVRLRDYRAAHRYSAYRVRRNPGEVLLTEKALVVIATPTHRFEPHDIAQLEARVAGDRLHLTTDRPPQATGRMEVELPIRDGDAWLAALSARGARTSPTSS